MGIVTIISDYGNKDHYVPALKGALLCEDKSFTIVDITHNIPLFSIGEAAFNIKNSFYHFPDGSIHLLCVAEEPRNNAAVIILEFQNHYFVGVDNGLPSLIVRDRKDFKVYAIDPKILDKHKTMLGVFSSIAGHLNRGGKPNILGREVNKLKEVNLPNPIVGADNSFISGTVQYIDHFGNLVTNISETLFQKVLGSEKYKIVIPRERDTIKKVYNSYNEVGKEDRLIAVFNTEGWLEIAINRPASGSKNSASALMGVEKGETVKVSLVKFKVVPKRG